jgi:1-acyl-sn-glycerol-3-phosphate acyltransferase
MPARISTTWRIVKTGFAFSVYWGLAVLLATVVVPLSVRLAPESEGTDLRAQRMIHHANRFFVWLLVSLGLIEVSRADQERLREAGAVVVVANHPTLIDAVLLIAMLPQVDCVVGKEWADNVFLKRAVVAARYLRNDEGPALVEEARRRLEAGRKILIFPEGTRSPIGGLQPFRRGAAHIALASGHDLLPVVVSCEPPILKKGQRWYEVADRAGRFRLSVEEPVSPQPYVAAARNDSIAARHMTADLRRRYEERLSIG